MTVGAGALHIPAQPGDIYGDVNTAKNLVLRERRRAPGPRRRRSPSRAPRSTSRRGSWLYTDDGNFVKFGRIAHRRRPATRSSSSSTRSTGRRATRRRTRRPTWPADFPKDYYLRIVSDGTNVTGAYSTDGTTWTPVGRPAAMPGRREDRHVRVLQRRGGLPGRGLRLVPPRGRRTSPAAARRPARAATTTSRASRSTRRAGTRSSARTPAKYAVGGGNLTITTELGDIYTGDTNPPPPNFILQSADHAGEDWTLETKLSGTITDGYAQGGLIAHVSGDNYVKFDAISDVGNTRINRLELRSEVAGVVQNPQGNIDVPAGTANIWLRLKKTGTSYSGEYSFDGTTWARRGPGAERDGGPGLRPVRLRAAGGRCRRHGVVRLLHARRAGPAERGLQLQRPRRRVRRDRARHREVQRDRPPGRHEGEGRGRQAEDDHRPRRHLHQQRPGPRRATSSCSSRPRRTTSSRPRSTSRSSTAATPRAASWSAPTTTTTSSSTPSPTSTTRSSTGSSCARSRPARS